MWVIVVVITLHLNRTPNSAYSDGVIDQSIINFWLASCHYLKANYVSSSIASLVFLFFFEKKSKSIFFFFGKLSKKSSSKWIILHFT